MQLRSSLSDSQPWKNAPKPPPHTLTHTSVYLHTSNMHNKLTGVYVCVSAYNPNLHCLIAEHIVPSLVNANSICREADILYRETTKHSHRYTHPASSLHSQSQIRWQIRRLILLGGRGIGVPPLLQVVPQDTYTPLTHTSLRGTVAHTNTSHRCPKTPPPIQVPAFSFTLSLHHRSLARSLPPSPSFSISPPSLSSLTANQTGGDIIVLQPVRRQDYECVCVMEEKRGE